MPLNSNLLYGEMAASWLAHLAIPVFISIIFPYFFYGLTGAVKMLAFIGLCCVLSFVFQSGFLSVIQASSCNGIHNVSHILKGSIVATVITGLTLLIPAFIQPMRLMVSQLFQNHLTLLTPDMATFQQTLAEAAVKLEQGATAGQQKGGGITQAEYDAQTFQEFTIGASYWGAFAGAYGFGIGSLYAGSCK